MKAPKPPGSGLVVRGLGTTAAAAIGNEILTGANFYNSWGGVFEIGYLAGGRAAKLSNVLYLTWLVEVVDGKARIDLVPTILKVSYIGELLVALVLRSDERRLGATLNRTEGFLIKPLHYEKMVTEDDIRSQYEPSLDHEYLCNFMTFRVDGELSNKTYTSVHRRDSKAPLIWSTKLSNGGIRIDASSELVMALDKAAQAGVADILAEHS